MEAKDLMAVMVKAQRFWESFCIIHSQDLLLTERNFLSWSKDMVSRQV